MLKKTLSLLLLVVSAQAENQSPNVYQKTINTLQENNIAFVDFQWVDINGNLKEITLPSNKAVNALQNPLYFDGSSNGFSSIDNSDLGLQADLNSLFISPWKKSQSPGYASIMCDILNSDEQNYTNCTRSCLKNVVNEAESMGYKTVCGAELEFFLFLKNEDNYEPIDTAGYCQAETNIKIKKFTQLLMSYLISLGVCPEKIHHEVAPEQFEVVLDHTDALTLADRIIKTKHFITTFAAQNGLAACFMPKPISDVNGSGMHIHASLKKDGHNAFYDQNAESYLSSTARSFITGVLDKAAEMSLLFNAEVNSAKRLVPGYEAPIFLCCAEKNRSAGIRIPDVSKTSLEKNNGAAVRIELRWPDATCNPYLALAGLFKSGIEGIKTNAPATPLINKNVYHMSQEEVEKLNIQRLPATMQEALALFASSSFVQKFLGTSLHQSIMEVKNEEWNSYQEQNPEFFHTQITQWEFKRGIKF